MQSRLNKARLIASLILMCCAILARIFSDPANTGLCYVYRGSLKTQLYDAILSRAGYNKRSAIFKYNSPASSELPFFVF